MKEIRTRPKDRDIQTRQTTAFLPKQAAKVLRENAARRQLTGKSAEQQEEAQSTFSEPAIRFETTAQRAAEISVRTAFRSGKALAQKQFDRAVSAAEPKEKMENAASPRRSEPPQITRAKQKFRQEQAKKQTERRRETVVREASLYGYALLCSCRRTDAAGGPTQKSRIGTAEKSRKAAP